MLPGEGGFHIHIYRNGTEVAKVSGTGNWAYSHRGKTLLKLSEINKTVKTEVNRLIDMYKKGCDNMDNYEKSLYLYNMGLESFQQKEFEKALEYFKQSLILDEHSRTYARIYECLISLGKYKEARPYIEKAYNMNKKHDKVAMQYVEELIKEKKISEAVSILEGILERNKTYKPARKLLEKIKNDLIFGNH